ncbi:VgrG-related protein [Amycolatopsis taiwanensis]|uniref:VgrG-related protein n=1 Tax=Amycolatopsis taiwanensis TaxID=342230 RepID=UPI0004812439|nr:VgrG-related protein [Amycolatopsis taiwanensis]
MANESYSGSLLVEVSGAALPMEIATKLTHAFVDGSRNLPDMFVLRFSDPERIVLAKTGIEIGSPVRISARSSDPGGPVLLLSGEVTALSTELDATGGVTEVRGYDHAHRLFRGRRVAAYTDTDLVSVVKRVAQRAQLEAGTIESVPGLGGRPDAQITQDNISDWEFLRRLADSVGAEVTVEDKALNFRIPQPPKGAPATTAKASTDPLVLEAGRNLIALRAGVTSTEQVPAVWVRSWDAERKQALSAKATPSTPGTEAPGVDPARLGSLFSAPPLSSVDRPYRTAAKVKAAADALAAGIGGCCAEVEGVARGNPRLRAGTAVALVNVGSPFEGRYTLTAARHQFDTVAGYTTSFTVSSRQERSLYGLVSPGGARPTGPNGLVPAVVSDVRDPHHLGRVRVTFPWLAEDYTSGWARTLQPGAGSGRGALVLPEVGDEVLVGFEHGDIDAPYVLGGLYNGSDKPPQATFDLVDGNSGQINGRAFVTRTGHRLEFAETAGGPEGVRLVTGDGKYLLHLDRTGTKIVLDSDGSVVISGSTGVTIDAGSEELKLTGRSVSLQARQEITVSAGTSLKLSGTGEARLEAAKVTVNGTASSRLTSSGEAVVRGTIVRIN